MKTWKPGNADEVWKVMVCARDANLAEDCLSYMQYVVGCDPATLTGKQIVDALNAYRMSAYKSVRTAIHAPEDKP